MKKLFLLICLMATTTIVSATDLWEGSHAVNWDNTLTIEAAKFTDAQVGQKIVVEFTNATGEVIELHSNGGMLGDDGKLGDQNTMTMTNEYAELNIENVDMASKLADVDRLMVQCNKEDGDPFNFTAIVLVKKEGTGIHDLSVYPSSSTSDVVYSLQGSKVTKATKGLYIVNGKKIIMK